MIIFIDPGHGGNDPGAIGPSGLEEKDVNLNIATIVKETLENHNVDVRLTRNDDTKIELAERVNMANNINADYFVSIHVNSYTNTSAFGTETYAYPNSVRGIELSRFIQRNLVAEIDLKNRGVKTSNFYVLRETAMPAALVEVAFISNPVEEKLLKEKTFINKAALGIAKGILELIDIEYNEENQEQNENNQNTDGGISDWAKTAMEWAASNEVNITDGSMPKEPITLERMITILYRYHKLKDS